MRKLKLLFTAEIAKNAENTENTMPEWKIYLTHAESNKFSIPRCWYAFA